MSLGVTPRRGRRVRRADDRWPSAAGVAVRWPADPGAW